MRKWVIGTAASFLLVVLSSGWTPWVDGLSGAFVPQDIAQDVAAARLFAAGVSPYGPIIREMHSQVVPVPVDQTFPYFPHPPFSLLVSWYAAYVSFETAALIWFSVSIALLFLLAALLAENLSRRPLLACFAFLLCWPPVLYNLEKGQWSILLAVLVALGWRALAGGALAQAGAWLGLAAAVKVFPAVMGGYLLLRSRRALIGFIVAGLIATSIPLAVIGLDAFPSFLRDARSNMPHWESFPSVTLSLHGAVARLFIGGQWATPVIQSRQLALIVDITATALLLGLAVWATRRSADDAAQAMVFAAWTVLLPVMNPQSLGHNGVLLAVPLVLTLRRVLRHPGWSHRLLWSSALVLVSVPRQTTWRLAPPPVDPWQGLAIVALPLWGALLLFGVAVALAVQPPAPSQRDPPHLC